MNKLWMLLLSLLSRREMYGYEMIAALREKLGM